MSSHLGRLHLAVCLTTLLILSASPLLASDWSVTPNAAVAVPLSAEIDTPDPTYSVGVGLRGERWGVSFDYTSGDGETDNGWITGGTGGDYDYFMAGLTLDYFIPVDQDRNWYVVLGSGPWFEHTEFTADASGPPPTSPALVSEGTDTIILCGKGALAYRWERIEASVSLRALLGADNITSSASFALGVSF